MALTPGTRIGPYEVAAEIGSGGMGIVYRARDTTLNRDVALKVLLDLFADDPERLARFQREAQVLASLNHPNIASIYGIEDGEAAGVRALVLELVEGPTLADRIGQGPLPLEAALPIARQIAEALDAAHERGIIHRDLKPANIKVKDDGTVKVLDFGLAKALAGDAGADPSQSPTLTAMTAHTGVIMGTAAYMSPEQARGKPVDKRADIWAFGAVLYEMLTGRRAFRGAEVSDILASVLAREPDTTALPPSLPAPIRRLLTRCLDKDPKRRLRDIGEALVQIEEASTTPSAAPMAKVVTPQPASWRRRVPPAVAAGLAAVLVVGLGVWWAMRPGPPRVARFVVNAPPSAPLASVAGATDLTISPDGTRIVYTAGTPRQLYVRSVDQLEGAPLRGTELAMAPFFSPDGNWVGFFSRDFSLRKMSVLGGPAVTLSEGGGQPHGASWGEDDRIIFSLNDNGGLRRVSAAGGEPEVLTTPDTEQGEASHRWPEILPGGRVVLFTISSGLTAEAKQVAVLNLDTGEQTVLIPVGSNPRYSPTGHIVYGTGGTLRAVPFDFDRLDVSGDPVPVLEGVMTKDGSGAANFSLARDGSLVYATGGAGGGETNTLVWVDRDGREEALGAEPGGYTWVRVSPDGAQLALDFDGDVQTYDTVRGTFNRVTTDPGADQYPLWTVDGERLVFESNRGGSLELFWTLADSTGTPERILSREGNLVAVMPEAWTADGTTLFFVAATAVIDIGVLSMEGERTAELLIQDEFGTAAPAISPDGRWIAYHSDLSGQFEIYVQRFPALGGRQPISTSGGRVPRWSPDGTELFYQSLDGRQMLAVPIVTAPTFTAGAPEVLFEGAYLASIAAIRPYDLTPDGERFVMIKPGGATSESDDPTRIILVQHWFETLTARIPVP